MAPHSGGSSPSSWVDLSLAAVKGGAEGVDDVALEAESDVGVDGGGEADVSVAEELLDDDEFDALLQEPGARSQEPGSGGVVEVVDTDAAEADAAEKRGEGAGEVGWVDGAALRSGEHLDAVLPRRACGPALALLLFVVLLQ